MAMVPAAQAATEVIMGPWMPSWIDGWDEAILGDISGTKKGVTRSGPFSLNVRSSRATRFMPPPPVFITTPTAALLAGVIASPASSRAMRLTATANWAKRSMRRASLTGMYRLGSKPVTSPAMRTHKADASNAAMGPMPQTPADRLAQNSSTVRPIGLRTPRPVTTALLMAPSSHPRGLHRSSAPHRPRFPGAQHTRRIVHHGPPPDARSG